MAEKLTNTIRIHPAGTKTTDRGKPTILAASAPVAFRKAQDVMVAATKYNNKTGFFSSEKSRTQKFQTECYELTQALRFDEFAPHERTQKGGAFVFIEFFCLSSDTFQNWKKEYEAHSVYPTHFLNSGCMQQCNQYPTPVVHRTLHDKAEQRHFILHYI